MFSFIDNPKKTILLCLCGISCTFLTDKFLTNSTSYVLSIVINKNNKNNNIHNNMLYTYDGKLSVLYGTLLLVSLGIARYIKYNC